MSRSTRSSHVLCDQARDPSAMSRRMSSVQPMATCSPWVGLGKAAESSNIKADEEALYWIAREATGSVRDAYTLFDQVAAFSDGHITFEKIHEKLGLTGLDSINSLVLACVQKKTTEALNIIDEILQKGISVEQVVLDCADYFRSLLLIKHNITKEALIGHRADRFPLEILNAWSSIQIEQALSIVLQLFRDLRFSIDPRFELELAVSRLAWLVDFVSPIDLKAAFDSAKNILSGNNAPQGSPRSFNPAGSLTEQFKAIVKESNKLSGTGKAEIPGNTTAMPVQNLGEKSQEAVQTTRNTEAINNLNTNSNKNESENKNENEPLNLNKNPINESLIEDSDALKKHIVQILNKKNPFLSSILEKSKSFEIKDNTLFISANAGFDSSILIKEKPLLQSTLTQEIGRSFKITITQITEEQKEKTITEKNTIPEFIQFIVNSFSGQILEKKLISNDASPAGNTASDSATGNSGGKI